MVPKHLPAACDAKGDNLVRPRNCVRVWLNCHRPLLTSPSLAGEGSNWYYQGACSKPEDMGILGWVTFTANQHVRKNGQEGAVGGSHRCQPAESFGQRTRPICSVWIFLGTCR